MVVGKQTRQPEEDSMKKQMTIFGRSENNGRYQVSLDVHDQSTYLMGIDGDKGITTIDHNVRGTPRAALAILQKTGMPPSRTEVIYEAGSLGFYPYRLFSEAGYTCRMIAPSSIPHRTKEQKTDRDDARDNLAYHRSGLLRYVNIPTQSQVEDRECLRYRTSLTYAITKRKQQILAFTKRQGLEYTLTKTNWTKKHRSWLQTVETSSSVRIVLDDMAADLEGLEQRLKKIDTSLDAIISGNEWYRRLNAYYSVFPGFGRVNSMIIILEGGSLDRFPHPSNLMNYVGLIPRKCASGTSDPALHITKDGNFGMRLGLVGASKVYLNHRVVEKALMRLDKIEDESLRALVKKTILRLSSRGRRLCARRKHVNKVRCAIARELCGFLWELHVRVMPLQDIAIAA